MYYFWGKRLSLSFYVFLSVELKKIYLYITMIWEKMSMKLNKTNKCTVKTNVQTYFLQTFLYLMLLYIIVKVSGWKLVIFIWKNELIKCFFYICRLKYVNTVKNIQFWQNNLNFFFRVYKVHCATFVILRKMEFCLFFVAKTKKFV